MEGSNPSTDTKPTMKSAPPKIGTKLRHVDDRPPTYFEVIGEPYWDEQFKEWMITVRGHHTYTQGDGRIAIEGWEKIFKPV